MNKNHLVSTPVPAPLKPQKPVFVPDMKILQLVYRHYISAKILDMYCTTIKDRLPSGYLENKNNDIVRACEKFYTQFDRKVPLNELDIINDNMLDYFEMFDYMLSLNKDDFHLLKNNIWQTIKESQKTGLTMVEYLNN